MRHSTRAFMLAAASVLATTPCALAAEENLGKEGVFTMIVVKDGTKFNRCVLHQGTGKNVLRIALHKNGAYVMSIPTAGQPKTAPLTINIDNKSGLGLSLAGQDKDRSWVELPPLVVGAIKNGRRTIDVELGTAKFKWKLNTDMKGSFIVLDSCKEGYTNGA